MEAHQSAAAVGTQTEGRSRDEAFAGQAALPQLIDFKTALVSDIFTLVSIHALSILIWFTCFIFLLGKGAKAFQSTFIKKSIQSLTGVAFIYLSYKILAIQSNTK